MTNVSKRKLPQKEFEKLFLQLCKTIAQWKRKDLEVFFNDLLGAEEKIMLTKRFAAVVMYIENNSSYRVAQLLKMSPSTAEAIHKDFEDGRYDGIRNRLVKQREDYKKFWETLETVLRLGMPPRGRGRWKTVFKN